MQRCVVLLATIGAFITTACGREPESVRPPEAPAGSRNFLIGADTLWIAGAAAGDDPFGDPWYLVAGGGGVLVVDYARGLVALDGSGARPPGGSRPQGATVLGPVAIFPDSTAVVVRSDNGGLQAYDVRGRRRRGWASTDAKDVRAACALDEHRLLLGSGSDQLAVVDRSGGATRAFSFPWRALRDSASLLRQTVLASSAGRPGCIIALAVGTGFAITRGQDSVTLHSFVEAFEPPPVRRTVETAGNRITTTLSFLRRATAAASLAADDSAIFVAFGGVTPRRRGLIDIYDRESGGYRGSLELGARILGLAAGNGALYVMHEDAGMPVLVALRLRSP
jgi:hypothetical protein